MTGTPDDGILGVREGVEARIVSDPNDAALVLALLDRVERSRDVPPVDESERERLRSLAVADETVPRWHGVLACRDARAVGYAGVVVSGGSGAATGDVVVARDAAPIAPALDVLFDVTSRLASSNGAHRLEVWLRHAIEAELKEAKRCGFSVGRRLAVLGRGLDDVPPVGAPSGVAVRHFRDGDADAVVDVLARAYAGTPDAGWTRERFDERRGYDWFDPADLLVADEGGEVVALHWTKRRDAHTGEVYNLAVHPDAQGRGLGGAMLRAGLVHLAEIGCREVILWVDRSNERGLRLYGAHGFEPRWEDVALTRELG